MPPLPSSPRQSSRNSFFAWDSSTSAAGLAGSCVALSKSPNPPIPQSSNPPIKHVPSRLRPCLRRRVRGGTRACRHICAAVVSGRGVRMALLEERHDPFFDALPFPLQPDQPLALPFHRQRSVRDSVGGLESNFADGDLLLRLVETERKNLAFLFGATPVGINRCRCCCRSGELLLA